jgi:hypothetical protein
MEYKPYCYLIGWSNLNVWYYGSEYGKRSKIANPKNLWSTYFTSSKHVKQFRKEHGEPDIISIRKTFSTDLAAIYWEYRVLRKLKVRQNSKWLNVNEGKAPVGTPWTEERKQQWSKQNSGTGNNTYGKPRSEETKQKISNTLKKLREDHNFIDPRMTPEARLKSANSNRNKTISDTQKQQIRESLLGRKQSEETKKKRSESLKQNWLKRKQIQSQQI